jgi:hypothetical protein
LRALSNCVKTQKKYAGKRYCRACSYILLPNIFFPEFTEIIGGCPRVKEHLLLSCVKTNSPALLARKATVLRYKKIKENTATITPKSSIKEGKSGKRATAAPLKTKKQGLR